MHSHDTDLIAALAERRLPLAAEQAAEAQIAGCRRCTEDLALQRAALAALSSAPEIHLEPAERSTLRAAVAEAIGLPVHVPAEDRGRSRGRIPWPAISLAAASLVAIVAIVPVLGLLSTGGTGDDATVAAEAPPSTTAARDLAGDALPEAAAGGSEPFAEQDLGSAALEAAPMTSTTAATADGDDAATTSAASVTTTVQRNALLTIDELTGLLSGDTDSAGLFYAEDPPCAEAASRLLGPDAQALPSLVELDDGLGTAFLVSAEDGTIERLIVLDTEDCAEVYAAP